MMIALFIIYVFYKADKRPLDTVGNSQPYQGLLKANFHLKAVTTSSFEMRLSDCPQPYSKVSHFPEKVVGCTNISDTSDGFVSRLVSYPGYQSTWMCLRNFWKKSLHEKQELWLVERVVKCEWMQNSGDNWVHVRHGSLQRSWVETKSLTFPKENDNLKTVISD